MSREVDVGTATRGHQSESQETGRSAFKGDALHRLGLRAQHDRLGVAISVVQRASVGGVLTQPAPQLCAGPFDAVHCVEIGG